MSEPYLPGADTPDILRDRARALLSPALFAHVIGGAGDERTTAANRAGYGRYRLLPRVLVDVSQVDTSVEILGTKFGAPIFTSPTGGISSIHPDGERGVARAAATAGVLFILNAWPGVTTEEVAKAAGPARWQQLYWQGNREIMADLVQRAEGTGYRAMVLTVDTGAFGTRRRKIRHSYRNPDELGITANLVRYTAPEWQGRASISPKDGRRIATQGDDLELTWKNVEWLRSVVKVPLALKGIMAPQDALRAIEIGADAVIVSNHGGRNLDGEPGTIEVLEDVVQAVHGRIPVLIDGGVRRASDIAIALGLGAAAVGLGSPVVFALACGGEEVVTAFLEDLVDDLGRTLRLLGVTSVAGMTRDHVSQLDRYVPDAALAPYLPPP